MRALAFFHIQEMQVDQVATVHCSKYSWVAEELGVNRQERIYFWEVRREWD